MKSSSNIGTLTTELNDWSSHGFRYNADIADSNVTLRQQWFEVYGIRRYGGQNNTSGKMYIDIDSWLASLPKGDRGKVLEIIRQHAPKLNKYKGGLNAFMMPEELREE